MFVEMARPTITNPQERNNALPKIGHGARNTTAVFLIMSITTLTLSATRTGIGRAPPSAARGVVITRTNHSARLANRQQCQVSRTYHDFDFSHILNLCFLCTGYFALLCCFYLTTFWVATIYRTSRRLGRCYIQMRRLR